MAASGFSSWLPERRPEGDLQPPDEERPPEEERNPEEDRVPLDEIVSRSCKWVALSRLNRSVQLTYLHYTCEIVSGLHKLTIRSTLLYLTLCSVKFRISFPTFSKT